MKLHYQLKSNPIVKMLIAFASQDDARYVFNGLFFDKKNEIVVSTDGRRMFASKKLYEELPGDRNLINGKIIEVKPYCEYLAYREIEGTFPDYEQVFPKYMQFSFLWEVPAWFSLVSKQHLSANVGLCFYGDEVRLEITKTNPEAIYVNMFFLQEFAGQMVKIYAIDKAHPIAIAPENSQSGNFVDNDWFAVIMPVKNDPGEPIKLEKIENN